MKVLIVETSPVSNKNDSTVHVRNSMLLAEYLSRQGHVCRLVWNDAGIPDINEQFDYMIYVSATFYFKYERFVELMKNQINCKIGSILNEYELFINDFLKQWGLDFLITNFVETAVKKAHTHDKYLMTNLNALQARQRNPIVDKKYDLCYYGTFRKHREPYFKKYLIKDMILSTSRKNVKRFLLCGCEDCWVTDKFSWEEKKETLNMFWATLGIEDTKTHKWFNYLPNRWFESLFTNTAIFFDKTCQGSIDKDVYKVDKWFMVDNYDEILYKIEELKRSKDINDHFDVNTRIALSEKEKCLQQIEKFLLNY